MEAVVTGFGEGPQVVTLDPAFHTSDDAVIGASKETRFAVSKKIVTDRDIRCTGQVPLPNGTHKTCNKMLARLAGRPWEIECPRCKTVVRSKGIDDGH